MAQKKISELTELMQCISSGDELIVNDGNETKKVKASLLVSSLAKIFAESEGAGLHNSIFRGKYLGNSLTAEQKAQIENGTFHDLWIGDYWIINDVTYRIAHFDYWLHIGYPECVKHHIVIVPDECLLDGDEYEMNDDDTTAGGYYNSKMRKTYLELARTEVRNAFGASNILTHKELLTNSVTDNIATSWSWYDSDVELMSETMVYGCQSGGKPSDDDINYNVGASKSQLALFRLDHSKICNRAYWWLRCVVSSEYFAYVSDYGYAYYYDASGNCGVRPAFAITA